MRWRLAQHLAHSYGELWLARGDTARALAYADECLSRAVSSDSKKNVVKARRLRGQVFLVRGELAAELRARRCPGGRPSDSGTRRSCGRRWRPSAIFAGAGRPAGAQRAYGEALAVIEAVASAWGRVTSGQRYSGRPTSRHPQPGALGNASNPERLTRAWPHRASSVSPPHRIVPPAQVVVPDRDR